VLCSLHGKYIAFTFDASNGKQLMLDIGILKSFNTKTKYIFFWVQGFKKNIFDRPDKIRLSSIPAFRAKKTESESCKR
jgi:hypothetical protein